MTKTEESELAEQVENLCKRVTEHRLQSEKMMEDLDYLEPKILKAHTDKLAKLKKEYEELDDILAVEHFLQHGAGRSQHSPNE
jgi:uncharacterized coiled-coil protein SlyX